MNTLGLAETINALRSRGYTEDFNLSEASHDTEAGLLHTLNDEFMIDQVFRFDVMSDPDDQSILYAIHSTKTGQKGILVNGFGIYSDARANRMVDKLLRPESELRRNNYFGD